MYPIIILEGPDCSGKTTLAQHIMELFPNHTYIHCATSPNIRELHTTTIAAAKELSENFCVIIDRLHLSEKIYGQVFRDGQAYNTEEFDRVISTFIPNLYKVLVITDKFTTMKLHKERQSKEMFSTIEKVWDLYNEVTDWKRYNYKTDNFKLEDYHAR